MKIFYSFIVFISCGILISFVDYELFLRLLSFVWYIISIIMIYSGFKYSFKYKFIQFRISKIISAIKSKSNNDIKPLSSLCMSLAAKIGVGSLSGVALSLYFGGLGSIFWLVLISLLLSINTYVECNLGIKYREKINNVFVGGPSFYIKKCLGNKYVALLYSVLIIVTYSGLFLSIQSNTIVSVIGEFSINKNIIVFLLCLLTFFIIGKNSKKIFCVNNMLVPLMLLFYLILGIYVIFSCDNILNILSLMIRDAFNIKSFIPVFLVGMQRGIFISESGLGTSAISAASCDNDADKQGMLEIMGIHITTFLVCMVTFLIIVTSDYNNINFGNINGIEIVMYAFKYHFGNLGEILLMIVTVMFAFSTIISGYFFGENNIKLFSNNRIFVLIFKIIFIFIIFVSCYVKGNVLWNLCDFFVAILALINLMSLLCIDRKK